MKTLVAVVGLTLVLVGCGSDKSDSSKSATTTTPNRQANSASTTIAPTHSFAMGEKGSIDPQATLQVFAYDQGFPAPSDSKEKPQAGNVFAAVDLEVCSTRDIFSMYPEYFRLELPGGRFARHRFTVKDPTFRMVVSAGCNRGWLSFEVPENQRPLWFRFREDYRWAIP